MAAKGKGSGIEVEARYAHVWTMRDGKGVRVDAYADRDAALEALQQDSLRSRLSARARRQPKKPAAATLTRKVT